MGDYTRLSILTYKPNKVCKNEHKCLVDATCLHFGRLVPNLYKEHECGLTISFLDRTTSVPS